MLVCFSLFAKADIFDFLSSSRTHHHSFFVYSYLMVHSSLSLFHPNVIVDSSLFTILLFILLHVAFGFLFPLHGVMRALYFFQQSHIISPSLTNRYYLAPVLYFCISDVQSFPWRSLGNDCRDFVHADESHHVGLRAHCTPTFPSSCLLLRRSFCPSAF